ncbi:MAG: carbohydrate binding domain-containing protein [Rikenellaceae bacterium]
MKKILTLVAIMFIASTASAQVLLNNDFEDGTIGKWAPWQNKNDQVKIVEGNKAKDSQYAMCYRTGVMQNFGGVKEGETYKVSFDSNTVWGKYPGYVSIQFYNKETKKLEEVKKEAIPNDKGFKRVEFTFTAKSTSGHRITVAPDGTKGGAEFIIDNMIIELVK